MMSAVLRHHIGQPHNDNDYGPSDFNMGSLRSLDQPTIASTNPVPEDKAPELHSCQRCQKEFPRLCDLNKHSKSHSRPFKCSHQDCKYYSLGWPTAKELERHVNDKHLAKPKTFPCLFPPCPYRSKRDSNRKQHMEKMHGWKYTRSKSNGTVLFRSLGTSQPALPPSGAKAPAQTAQYHDLLQSVQKPQFVQQDDFLLYDQDGGEAAVSSYESDDGDDEPQDPNSQESDVVVPWTSPETRLQRRKTDLLEFSEKFNQIDRTSSAERSDVPIDPDLALIQTSNTLIPSADKFRPEGKGIPSHSKKRLGYSPPGELDISANVSEAVRSSAGATYSPSFRQAPGSSYSQRHGGPSRTGFEYYLPAQEAPQQARNRRLPPIKRKEDEEEDDDDDEPPQKKLKASPESRFNDSQMPDIFHAAYPDTYNKDKKPLYQSCHTSHHDISTLVRHLKRPAHRLEVNDRYVHSFDVEPRDGDRYVHCRVGVCRRCWQVYTKRAEFDLHVSTMCEKVSKGKEQKFRCLYDAFTPFTSDTLSLAHGIIPPAEIGLATRHLHVQAQPDPETALRHMPGNHDDSPHDAPSPTTVELGTPEEREPERSSDIEKVRRQNQRLIALAQSMADGILALEPTQGSLRNASSGNSNVNAGTPTAMQLKRLALKVTETFGGRRQLLEHENTRQPLPGLALQQTELPRGMEDDINSQQDEMMSRQSLSRSSSGLSNSNRTIVRHVPNSPPQQFEDFVATGNAVKLSQAVHPLGNLRHINPAPASHPDSAYVSGNRSSLTETEAAHMKSGFPVTLPNGTDYLDQTGAGEDYAEQLPFGYEQTPAEQQSQNPDSPSTVFEGMDLSEAFGGYTISRELMDTFGWSQPSQHDS